MSEVEKNEQLRTADGSITARPETALEATPARGGIAHIKPEYLLNTTPIVDSADTSALNDLDADDAAEGRTADRGDSKRRKTEDKRARKGQTKNRQLPSARESGLRMCRAWETTGMCERAHCKFAHDWHGYFATKARDVQHRHHPGSSGSAGTELRDTAPFVELSDREIGGEDDIGRTIDLNTTCPVLEDLGYCPYGWRCRFLGGHVKKRVAAEEDSGLGGSSATRIDEWELLGSAVIEDKEGWRFGETNWTNPESLIRLRKNAYEFPKSKEYLKKLEPEKEFTLGTGASSFVNRPASTVVVPVISLSEEDAFNETELLVPASVELPQNGQSTERGVINGEIEAMDVPPRPEEKRRLNWENGLYLAPLTTVGNLPFRRLCVDYGATITVSEMALAQNLVTGHADEWALTRRHASEKTFGIQMAGGYPNRMVPAAEMLAREIGSGIDFVDVNLGCPIDMVFNQGAGSALMDSPSRLGKILLGMNRALGDIPLTVKFRTGVAHTKPNAHKLIPRFATEWGASALTLHGRSRQQRYSKLADWEYIRQCATTLRETLSDAGMAPIPIFGNGDCFSAQGYYEEKEKSGVDGVMVARGALIKPWIFTEVAERREWDISAVERLEGIRKFAEYGLAHWGSDTMGINTTRRFLCEALSFQHRYIPIGLLERLPPMLNERPPAYMGRNELETLLSSPYSGDWVKISEMFLGPVAEDWKFVPKHKSNAYGREEAQG